MGKEHIKMEPNPVGNSAKGSSKQKDLELPAKKEPQQANLCPYVYTGHGDSYFVSRPMYNAMVAKCRCGREKSETHLLKCLKKGQDISEMEQEKYSNGKDHKEQRKLPQTSNGFFGYVRQPPSYMKWEQSMKYISPIATMPGHRLTAKPYNTLFIG